MNRRIKIVVINLKESTDRRAKVEEDLRGLDRYPIQFFEAIDAGRPVPVGWLHKGHVSAPSGGGHYSVIIGYTNDAWIVHDPNGPAKLVPGGYEQSFNGANQSYSFKNFNPRWIVEGEGSGWYMDIRLPS